MTSTTSKKNTKKEENLTTPSQLESTEIQENTFTHLEQVNQDFKNLLSTLSNTVQTLKTLTSDAKKLEKQVNKVLKDNVKKQKNKKETSTSDKPKRAPSGFAKPSNISEELCNFLGRPLGTQLARTEVTKLVTQYIKDNELQNPSNKRHILPDQKLGSLLNASKNDEVTYFNLQKYMKHHFPKGDSNVSS